MIRYLPSSTADSKRINEARSSLQLALPSINPFELFSFESQSTSREVSDCVIRLSVPHSLTNHRGAEPCVSAVISRVKKKPVPDGGSLRVTDLALAGGSIS
jgi:hypothetical protein